MQLAEVIFTEEAMWKTFNFLANTEYIMFSEKEPSILRGEETLKVYGKEMIRRCEDLKSKLNCLKQTLKEYNFEEGQGITGDAKSNMEKLDTHFKNNNMDHKMAFETYEKELKKRFDELNVQLQSRQVLIDSVVSNKEKLDSLSRAKEVVPSEILERSTGFEDKKLKTFYGLVPTENVNILRKILFRYSRGNLLINMVNLDNSHYVVEEYKNKNIVQKSLIFVITPCGEGNRFVKEIEKQLFYQRFEELEMPFAHNLDEMRLETEQNLNDNIEILDVTNDKIKKILRNIIGIKGVGDINFISICQLIIAREMNFAEKMFLVEKRDVLYSVMIWIPSKYYDYIDGGLSDLTIDDYDPSEIPPRLIKLESNNLHKLKVKKTPTYFELNALSAPFQEIVDTYGVPRYKEANPGLFTIISFPFFFGLMFGDVGHGSLVLFAGIIMVATIHDKNHSLYQAKWMIFLMGFFATYCGLIYSEWFASVLPVFKSCYDVSDAHFKRKEGECNYPIGFDYIWYLSENETAFLNSFKMKFSIIIGVIQMLFGVILKASNGIYFGLWENVVFEAIPQFLFMFATFGYMSIAIILKWLTDWTGRESEAVSIIQMFINFTSVDVPLFGDGTAQKTLQNIFLWVCVIGFFVMLIPKPIVVYCRNKKKQQALKKNKELYDNDSGDHIMSKFYPFMVNTQ
jgi:V-type H+-transporting ATPase subunit a